MLANKIKKMIEEYWIEMRRPSVYDDLVRIYDLIEELKDRIEEIEERIDDIEAKIEDLIIN